MQTNPYLPGTPDEYIQANMNLAQYVAWEFIKKAGKDESLKFDKDDYLSIAYIGLVKAYKGYNPTGFTGTDGDPIKFSTYAVQKIRGEILRHIRDYGRTIRRGRESSNFLDVDSLDCPLTEGENRTLGDVIELRHYDYGEQVVVRDFLSQIGPRLRRVYKLREMGLSQQEVGDAMGISQVSIGRMERYLLESARQYGLNMDLGERTMYRGLKAV